ncbi:MAG TPA: hypothetical protein DDW50_02720, partial [Firmicutes bacterium]|nr:hypothetical protein [Bacillota bacterium]
MSIYPAANLIKQVEQAIECSSQRPITLVQYLPCLVVSSETELSMEQSMLLARLEANLREKGFSPTFWRTVKSRNFEEPWDPLESDHTLFSIVFLDGLTPNLLYKYGILKGTGKTVILLQSKDAQTTIKGLYNSAADSGLEAKVFHHNFSDPLIDLSTLLPLLNVDYLGSINPKAIPDDASHLDSILQEAFIGTGNTVMEALKKRLLFQIPPEYAEEFTTLFGIFEEYYHTLFTDGEFGQIASLQTVYPTIKRAAEYYHFTVPNEFTRLLASSFTFRAMQKLREKPEKELSLKLALEIYQDQLKATDNQLEKAFLFKEIASIHTELLLSSGSEEYAEIAIQAFQQALQIYSPDLYPFEFGMIQNNLGVIRLGQTLYSHSKDTLEYAITAFQNAAETFQTISQSQYRQICNFNLGLTLSLETDETNPKNSDAVHTALKEFNKTADIIDVDPELMARINQNCGLLYHQLIKTEPTEEIYDKTVNSLNDALRFWNSGPYSIESAIAWANIGEASLKMAESSHSSHYFQQAINSFFEFFKVYPSKDSRRWGQAERSLGDAYFGLATLEKSMTHFHSAISFYLEALEYFNAENFPADFLWLQNKLAMIYHWVAKAENSAPNYHQAIAAWVEALKVIPQDNLLQHAQINLKMAQSYSELASLEESLKNIHLANKTYHHLTAVLASNHDKETVLILYQEALYGLGNTAMELAVHEDALTNYHAALDALEEAFHSGPVKQNQIKMQSQLGDACWNLALLEKEPLLYCKKALEAYDKLLSIDHFSEDRQNFAKIQVRLGDIFAILADYEEKNQNFRAGIHAYQAALQAADIPDKNAQDDDSMALMTPAEI